MLLHAGGVRPKRENGGAGRWGLRLAVAPKTVVGSTSRLPFHRTNRTSHRRRHTRPTDDPNGSWSRSVAQGERQVLVECPLSSSERDGFLFYKEKWPPRCLVSSFSRPQTQSDSITTIRHQANTHPYLQYINLFVASFNNKRHLNLSSP